MHSVPNYESMCDDELHTTRCRTSDRTRDTDRVNSSSPSDKYSNTEPRAGARASSKNTRKRKNPVLFTIGIVLAKMNLYRADKRTVRSRADVEIKARGAGIEILNQSGVDWPYFEQRWGEFSIQQRENVARNEIIPYLLGNCRRKDPPPMETEPNDISPPKREDIREVRRALETAFSLPQSKASKPKEEEKSFSADGKKMPSPAPAPSCLSSDELKILLSARGRSRAVNSM